MTVIANHRVSLWVMFIAFIKGIFINKASNDPENVDNMSNVEPKSSKSFSSWIVRHSYRSKGRKRKKRKGLSYVSLAILEDYGAILSRRERKRLMKLGMPFTPYYN